MAADVALAERDAAVQTRAPTPTAPLDFGFRAMLSYAHGDPDKLASQIVSTGRTQDPRLWNEIQQTLGNAMASKILAAITQRTHPEVAPAPDLGAAEAAAPDVATDALPAQVELEVLGVRITAPAGVRQSALDELQRIIYAEVAKNEYAQKHFRESKVAIVIVPAQTAMTDLPEFVHLKGKKTFDGRDWSTVRGSGGTPSPNGRYSIAVAEEAATRIRGMAGYGTTYSVGMHELAHVLESNGMTRAQQARVKQLYKTHIKNDPKDANDTFTDKYGSENEQEYFAQSTNAFFDRNVMGKNHSGRAWLQQTDPEMYAFLVDLYDHQRTKDGDVVT
ncbi:hypothetical protein BH11MYX1_BH11MYX1_02400 [soil metagenome]